MALQAAYKQFLAAPNTSFLTDDASLHYITTLTTFKTSVEIIKHLKSQGNQIKKKSETYLDVVEGHNAIAVEIETNMEFVTSGGAYLPGLDDNFLADQSVVLPIIHIVSFDSNNKITQIRQTWDQGSLLKLIDVIGKTGRNWPIRDGKDQIKLITNSVKSSGKSIETGPPKKDFYHSREDSTSIIRDPHSSLSIFTPREQDRPESKPAGIEQAKSAKPAPRDYGDLFVGQDAESRSEDRVNGRGSPERHLAPKGGQNKNYQPSRIFDEEAVYAPTPAKPDTKYRTVDPRKYEHFDMTAVDDALPARKPNVAKSTHASSWDFDNFQTPGKIVPGKVQRAPDTRHWGTEDDEVVDTPVRPKFETKARKDADTHFEFDDQATPAPAKRIIGRPRGPGQDSGMGLYRGHNVYDDDEVVSALEQPIKPKAPKASGNAGNRNRNDAHFSFEDQSPAGHKKQHSIPDAQAKAVKSMNAQWDSYDQSPITNQKENVDPNSSPSSRPSTAKGILSDRDTIQHKGITIAGDGMGSRKATEASQIKQKTITIAGDGMGSRKGYGSQWWDFGEGEEEKAAPPVNRGRSQNGYENTSWTH